MFEERKFIPRYLVKIGETSYSWVERINNREIIAIAIIMGCWDGTTYRQGTARLGYKLKNQDHPGLTIARLNKPVEEVIPDSADLETWATSLLISYLQAEASKVKPSDITK